MAVYLFADEPRGSVYRRLIRVAGTLCTHFVLVKRLGAHQYDSHRVELLEDRLSRFRIGDNDPVFLQMAENMDSLLGLGDGESLAAFRLDSDSIIILNAEANALFEWQAPRLLDDLTFLRADGSAFLVTTSHHYEASVDVAGAELRTLEAELPEVALVPERPEWPQPSVGRTKYRSYRLRQEKPDHATALLNAVLGLCDRFLLLDDPRVDSRVADALDARLDGLQLGPEEVRLWESIADGGWDDVLPYPARTQVRQYGYNARTLPLLRSTEPRVSAWRPPRLAPLVLLRWDTSVFAYADATSDEVVVNVTKPELSVLHARVPGLTLATRDQDAGQQ